MADTPWTKGPWEIIDGSVLVPRGGSTSRPVGIRGLTVSHYSGPRGNDEESANARLIAAAPEMAEFLLTVRDYISDAANGAMGPDVAEMAKGDLASLDEILSAIRGDQ